MSSASFAVRNTPLNSDDEKIRRSLEALIGLKLAVARRAADMLVIHFGTMRPAPQSELLSLKHKPRGTVGDVVLHIQCPWRIESDDGILTGRFDLREPRERHDGFRYDNWDYEKDGNLQDRLIGEFVSDNENLFVDAVSVQSNGTFTLSLTTGHRLVAFPSGSLGEDWRLFRPTETDSHLVISGGAIERDGS